MTEDERTNEQTNEQTNRDLLTGPLGRGKDIQTEGEIKSPTHCHKDKNGKLTNQHGDKPKITQK